jgi:hypothetical protein
VVSAIRARGSIAVEAVVPTVATTAVGTRPAARSSAMAASSSSGRSAKSSSVGIRRRPARPMPRVMQAFSTLLWASAEA